MDKNILIYGDSLTWGKVPMRHERFGADVRWPAVLQSELGVDCRVIEEGLRGRMLAGENPHYPERDGLRQFGPILASHLPLDILVIMLGTNDCSEAAGKNAERIAHGLYEYAKATSQWTAEAHTDPPKLVFIAPPRIDEATANSDPRRRFTGSEVKSKQLARYYEKAAEHCGALFFDAANCAVPSKADGLHLDSHNQQKLGRAFAAFIRPHM